MKLPTVHMNGTSAKTLSGDLESAVESLDAAIDRLAACAPNARDYYPQGNAAFGVAIAEHRQRVDALRMVRADLTAIWEHVENQQ